jgi:fused signal recognition particle receptor
MLGWFKKKKTPQAPEEQALQLEQEPLEPEAKTSPEQPLPAESGEPAAPEAATPPADPLVEPPAEPEDEADQAGQPEAAQSSGPSMLKRLSQRLSRTRESFTARIDELFLGKKQIDGELFDELEEILVTADLGIATTQELLEEARKQVKRDNLSDPRALKEVIKNQLKDFVGGRDQGSELQLPETGPLVIMVVGVNGVGKTTTIGKIARKFVQSGQSVLLVAADTFRAAATSQLKIWGERNEVRVIAQQEGADPSAVVYDAMAVATSKDYDVVLVDTAGRLHTKVNLMEELKKINRVMNKQLEGAPHETLLVIDATTGQNGISQARLFNEAIGVTGIALTKLDGTAKGGIVVNITRELGLPIRFIGVGEQADDLRDFNGDEFIEALFAPQSGQKSGHATAK